MPAINPQEVETQINQLFTYSNQPEYFISRLQKLFERYADHVYRPGKASALPSLVASYHVPPPLLHELEKKLSAYSKTNPKQALSLAEALWELNYIEFKVITIPILKAIPITESSSVFSLIEKWIIHCKNRDLIKMLRDLMADQFFTADPLLLIDQIQRWIKQDNLPIKKFGYQVMTKSIANCPFDYLPAIYKITQTSLYETTPVLRDEITDTFIELTKRSPKEVAYLLHSAYQMKPHPNFKRIIRATMAYFPAELQVELEKMIRQ